MKKLMLIIAVALLLQACAVQQDTPDPREDFEPQLFTQNITTVSAEEVKEYFEQLQGLQARGGFGELAVAESVDATSSFAEVSTTNNQVAGVDEADIVKTDGQYIYVINQQTLTILDKELNTISTQELPVNTNYATNEIILDGDQIIVIAHNQKQSWVFQEYSLQPYPSYEQLTSVILYEASNKENLEQLEHIEVPGSYYQARFHDNKLLVLSQQFGYANIMPFVRTSRIAFPIDFIIAPHDPTQLMHVTLIDTKSLEVLDADAYTTNWATTVMASQENVYLAYQQNAWSKDWQQERFEEVVVPNLPEPYKSQVESLSAWDQISTVLEEMFTAAQEDKQLREQIDKLLDKVEEYEVQQTIERSSTIIYKVSYDEVLGEAVIGQVPGRLLNQFALDEYQNNLRVATTVNAWTQNEQIQYNNVYVLNEDMQTIGELTDIAPDERIFAVRFMQDTAYMVTFRQVDPLFVIDLSNPENPVIHGELKIPGFSNYLHPIGEGLLVGVGRDANEEGRREGLKISLFDVSDPKNPVEVDNYVVGNSRASSPVEYDHKAFLYDPRNEYVVLPVQLAETENYDTDFWHGALVFSVDQSISRIADIEHQEVRSSFYNNVQVLRSLYIDEVLYTLSNQEIVATDLQSFDEIDRTDLPYEEVKYDYPVLLE